MIDLDPKFDSEQRVRAGDTSRRSFLVQSCIHLIENRLNVMTTKVQNGARQFRR
jgi:hypothetical protein